MFYTATPATCQQQRPYVDKWEPFDIRNNPHVDKFESSLTQFGVANLASGSLAGTVQAFAAPTTNTKRVKKSYKTL